MNHRLYSRWICFVLLAGAISNSGYAQKGVDKSLEKEVEIGKKLAAAVERQVVLVDDPEINEYIDRIGQTLVQHSGSKLLVTFKVVKSEEINAFTLPGGFVYINSGVLLAAENEGELAAVLATQVAHVAARHTTESSAVQRIASFAPFRLVFVGGPAGLAVRHLNSFRNTIAEADSLGLQYLYKAGYDPAAAITLLQKLQAAEAAKSSSRVAATSDGISTHPSTSNRIANARKEIARLPVRGRYIVTTPEFDQIKARL
jgi:predicted Zn-dependent protease